MFIRHMHPSFYNHYSLIFAGFLAAFCSRAAAQHLPTRMKAEVAAGPRDGATEGEHDVRLK
jgi:hypothetical protein